MVRGGILSVDQGQHEAASALGLPKGYQFTRIVFPRAALHHPELRQPADRPDQGHLAGLLRLAARPLRLGAERGSAYPGDIVPLLLVATAWYLILTSVVSVVQFYVERYYSRGALRSLPPTPLQKARTGLRDLRARVRKEAAI